MDLKKELAYLKGGVEDEMVSKTKALDEKEETLQESKEVNPPFISTQKNQGVTSVDLMYNTGYNATNYPSSFRTALSSETLSFKPIYIPQDKILSYILIEATYQQVKNADYLYLNGNTSGKTFTGIEGYIIIGVEMMNNNCAKLIIQIDPFATIGIENMEILTGWAKRLHTSNDELFANNVPEPFSSAHPTKITQKVLDVGQDDQEGTHFIASNFDLSKFNSYLQKIYDTDGSYKQFPFVKTTSVSTKVHFPSMRHQADYYKTMKFITLYDAEDLDPSIFDTLQGLNLMEGIIASYKVPKRFLHRVEKNSNNAITEVIGDGVGFPSLGLPYMYAEVRNKKACYTNNIYHLISLTSGSKQSFLASEIYSPNYPTEPTWVVRPDVSPYGKTYAHPEYYRGYKGTGFGEDLVAIVEGSQWCNVPISSAGGAGWLGINALSSLSSQIAGNTIRTLGAEAYYNSQITGNEIALNNLQNETTVNDLNARSSYLKDMREPQREELLMSSSFRTATVGRALAWYKKRGISDSAELLNPQQSTMHDLTYDHEQANISNALNASNQMTKLRNTGLNLSNSLTQSNLAGAIANARLNAQKETIGYTMQAQFVAPSMSFPAGNTLQEYIGDTFVVIQERLSDIDVKRYDDYLQRFGYATSEPLTIEKMTNRQNFNFVQAVDVTIRDKSFNCPHYLIELAEKLLAVGVRLWHQPPSKERLENNPIKKGV